MTTEIFNGEAFAMAKLAKIQQELTKLKKLGKQVTIAAILFTEDTGSQLYTKLKREAANRVGIHYKIYRYSVMDAVGQIQQLIEQLNNDASITGIIIQKPWRKTFLKITGGDKDSFQAWWGSLVEKLAVAKDVDGLHPSNLSRLKLNQFDENKQVLPATCQAVLDIVRHRIDKKEDWFNYKIVIIGRSDLLGLPLFYYLRNQQLSAELIGKKELKNRIQTKEFLLDADLIISSTGVKGLITGEMIKSGSLVIDVGEPQADCHASVRGKAAFLTPVPGGVGPVTVACLMENGLKLAKITK